jgi:hypothetical protein
LLFSLCLPTQQAGNEGFCVGKALRAGQGIFEAREVPGIFG